MAAEYLIPALYVDAIELDESVITPVLSNRDPEPNHTNVTVSTNITLEITDVLADGIDESKTKVHVDGQLAFDGGSFESGFDGSGSASTAPDAYTRRIVIDPTTDFDSESVVSVRVLSETAGGSTLDKTYSFTIEDLTQPQVVGASAKGLDRVRVSFSEAVKQAAASESDDALNPSNYTLTRLTAPAVDAVVASVEIFSESAVDLITDIDLSPDAQYKVAVSGVEDLWGNVVDPAHDEATFLAFRPPRPSNRRFRLLSFLPEINRREDVTADLESFSGILQEVTDLLLYDIDRWTEILDPDFAPEDFLDLMLADLGNPFVFDLDEIDKRRLLRVLVAIYKQKGTEPGVKNAVRFFMGLEIDITQYLGESLVLGESELGVDWILGPTLQFNLYAFDVTVYEVLTDAQRNQLRSIVIYMRPAHTHFVNLIEPTIPEVIDHLELGLSELGVNWELH